MIRGNECWCGETTGTAAESDNCDIDCEGDVWQKCGGNLAYSSYTTKCKSPSVMNLMLIGLEGLEYIAYNIEYSKTPSMLHEYS